MAELTLYQRDDCPLCDSALAVLAQAKAPDVDSLWVDGSAALEARYGTRLPVLRDQRDGRELDWPFDAAAVRAFLESGQAARRSAATDCRNHRMRPPLLCDGSGRA